MSAVDFTDAQLRIIITGGPGVGKSSIIKHYEKSGLHVVHEAATDIIREKLAQEVVEPWSQDGFNLSVLELQLNRQQQAEAKKTQVVFFDRSPVDVLTYTILQKDTAYERITHIVESVISRQYYHRKIFLIENLGMCETNEVRAESLEEAKRIEEFIENHYRKYGFEIIRIPPATIEERAQMILDHLKEVLPNGTYQGSTPDKNLRRISGEAVLVQQ